MSARRAHGASVVDMRPTTAADGEFFAPSTWLAIDSAGRRFGSDSQDAARALAEHYNRRPPRGVQAALERSATKAAPRRFTGEPITGFGELA